MDLIEEREIFLTFYEMISLKIIFWRYENMKKDTKNLISLLWVSKGYMLVGTALAVAGSALAMRGAYWEGAHTMLAGMIRLDKEKSLEIIDKVRDEKDSID